MYKKIVIKKNTRMIPNCINPLSANFQCITVLIARIYTRDFRLNRLPGRRNANPNSDPNRRLLFGPRAINSRVCGGNRETGSGLLDPV